MDSSIGMMLEAETGLGVEAYSENKKQWRSLEPLSQSVSSRMKTNIERVEIIKENDTSYLVEFSNNLENYIKDNDCTLEEAVDNIASHYAISERDICLVLDESCVDKIDIGAAMTKYKLKRK